MVNADPGLLLGAKVVKFDESALFLEAGQSSKVKESICLNVTVLMTYFRDSSGKVNGFENEIFTFEI